MQGLTYILSGNFVYTNVVVTVLLKISLETSTWTFWNWLSNVGSGFLWLMYVLMLSKFWPSVRVLSPEMMAGQGDHIFSSAVFWFSALLVPFIVISRDFLYKVYVFYRFIIKGTCKFTGIDTKLQQTTPSSANDIKLRDHTSF